jgi:SPW repeat
LFQPTVLPKLVKENTLENRNYKRMGVGQNWEETNMNERPVGVPARSSGENSWVNILLGIWVIISPFVLGIHSAKGVWNNIVTGAVVGILALVRWRMHRPGWSWLNLILGIWLVISPFVLFVSGVAMWNNVILGIIIAASALSHTYFKASPEASSYR